MFVIFLIFMGMLGAAMGSFACCQAWRIHDHDKSKWSKCENCGKKLHWYENIPIFSWLALRGKCSKCHKFIGWSEIISELAMATVFILAGIMFINSGLFLDGKTGNILAIGSISTSAVLNLSVNFLVLSKLIVFIIVATVLWILLIFDAKWGELPVWLMVVGIIFAVLYQCIILLSTVHFNFVSLIAGVGILSGTYYLLYFFSHEKLVGGGDWILCLIVAIMLGRWELCLIELMLANLLAVVFELPQYFKKKQKQFPFGPFLVIAFFVIYIFQNVILKIMLV